MEVVQKEIQKLLDADVIYPISDSRWVSPVHVVPKKTGSQLRRMPRERWWRQESRTGGECVLTIGS
ncbi:unnamed protein product [Rhodiola kirilowii]